MTIPDLEARIQAVVNRTRVHANIAAEVLAELSTTHVVVEREEYAEQHDELAEVVGAANRVLTWIDDGDQASIEQSIEDLRKTLGEWGLIGAYDLDPIGHIATESDTSET